ncbi:hypothetical protein F2Q69_00009545 [Brassica cretica]|uniref:Uncharacterized protein n=1 Tax=Brassica cretica TaxID=69181 RepID=A0A8S9P6K6_BRACR|nr:hypothetical protein F2Q69_00009545 [Brassica cretica]
MLQCETSRSKQRVNGSTRSLLASKAQKDSGFRTLKWQETVVATTLLGILETEETETPINMH